MNPLVSVIIPVFNRAHTLAPAIESVKAQGLNIEIIIVDDGSTDQSAKSIRELAEHDSSIRPYILEKNMGGGYARNVGIDAAQGDWIAFLDSDDIWLKDKLKLQLATLLAESNSKPALCFTNLLVDFHDSQPLKPWNTEEYNAGDNVKAYILDKAQVVQTSTILMSANAAKAIRFNDSLRRHQDIDFVLRCQQAGLTFAYVPECLVKYSADPKANRVSKRVNATPSLVWLEVAKEYLTQSEIDAFYLKHVFDMHFKDKAISALVRGIKSINSVQETLLEFTIRVLKLLTPVSFKTSYKKLLNKSVN
ncbi:MAG TPA: glycosyltransferase family A protein [Methylophilaceae bacterium]|jgi:glycosyltransferase involved in cell wall biosynthesis